MEVKELYVMKIKGVNNMPDFIQVRDAAFTLIGYFRADKPQPSWALLQQEYSVEELAVMLGALPYGHLVKLGK
jgi:hypothetical protein